MPAEGDAARTPVQAAADAPGAEGPGSLRPAAFLDRDGTIMVEREFLADPGRVQLIPGAVEGLLALRGAGYALVVVTNQSGIARGLFALDAFRAVQARLEELLAAEGIRLDGVFLCPHHPDFDGACACRKPAPGLYLQAAAELGLDLRRSLFVGDRLSDVQVADALGGTGILLRTGYGRDAEATLADAAAGGATAALAGRLIVLDSLGALADWEGLVAS